MGAVSIGVDPGQRRDPTAIAVVEAEGRGAEGARPEVHHSTRHLERLPLGTSYPHVAERVAAVCAGAFARSGEQPVLYVDATGVGTPVVDTLRAAGIEARIVAVYFTHGDRRHTEGGEVRLGKAWLVSRLQAMLQAGRLHLPKTPEAEALGRELLDYEIRVDQDANDRYGAFKTGAHDDLVTALGLATQTDPDLGGIGIGTVARSPEWAAVERALSGVTGEGCTHRRSRGLSCPDCEGGGGSPYDW